MIKGTRILLGKEAMIYQQTINCLRNYLLNLNYEEIILPALWEQETFINKAGSEIINQMYAFNDKADRPICLIPEATAIIQEIYKQSWEKTKAKPVRLFYVSKCYRYEKPQAGRYREFTQFGVELLGNKSGDAEEIKSILSGCLQLTAIDYEIKESVKRGLDYYTEDGFEVECSKLGAQKQIAGGGRYDVGIGFAIGIDRLLLSLK